MDPLDVASDYAVALPGAVAPPVVHRHIRDLTSAELDAIARHLVGTEMPVTTALRAVRVNVDLLTTADLDKLARQISRCASCTCWTWLAELVGGRCPDCLAEQEDWDE
jgi:hypothetical protein